MSHINEPGVSEIPAEKLQQGRQQRIPYFEMREVEVQKMSEEGIARQIVGKEIRDLCRPEIDEYVDCITDRMFTVLKCKPLALRMRRCVAKYELHSGYASNRIGDILEERQTENKDTPADPNYRAQFNKCYVPSEYNPDLHKL